MSIRSVILLSTWIIANSEVLAENGQSIPKPFQSAIEAVKKITPNEPVTLIHDEIPFLREMSLKPDIEDSFHTVNVCRLVERFDLWNKHLSRVKVHYAVKTNHDLAINNVMAALGSGFDCASKREMVQTLQLGVNPQNIIFSHPRKPISEIKFAEENHIKWMVFDSIEELDKMLAYAPSVSYLLRIKTEDSHSVTPLSDKFGASLEEAYHILDYALKKKAPIVGIAFHVGSNNLDETAYSKALQQSSTLFKYSEEKWHHSLTVLDIGGGWPGNHDERFVLFAKTVNRDLNHYFPKNIEVIAEPGRFFASPTITAAIRIIGTQVQQTPAGPRYAYYLANGAYGFFASSIYYHFDGKKLSLEGWDFKPLFHASEKQTKLYPSLFWGPTCDAGDKILDSILFPKMQTNEFIYTQNIGAYSLATQSNFNQITPSKAYYVCSLNHLA